MSLLAVLAEEAHDLAPMIMEPIWFPIIAAGVFVALGIITYSYRDVANRHSHKAAAAAQHEQH
jgi:hypothetical protein